MHTRYPALIPTKEGTVSNPSTQPDRDPELSEIARQHPGWELWRAFGGLYHGRLAADHTVKVTGEDRQDLADMIRRAESKRATS